MTHMVIVGASLAGANCAIGLREAGFDGRVTMLGDEPGVPFGRPPLSKEYLRGEDDLSAWEPKRLAWYDAHDVALGTDARVRRVDPRSGHVVLDDGTDVSCDRVLIATGCRVRVPPVPGVDLDGVLTLRRRADADAIRARATRGSHAVVVGMGFIGSEVAASLRQLGVGVTAVLPGRAPLSGVLGDEVAARLGAIHEAHGVELVRGDKLAAFRGGRGVEAAVTESGRTIECSFAVVGVGVQPNTELLEGSGVHVDDGVLVDASCRTSVQNVFAAGDVANHDHPILGGLRVEHFNNAEKQGRHAARAMLGDAAPYDYVHSFWSDQYEDKLEYVGYAREWDQFVVREDAGFLGFYLSRGVVKAAVGLNRGGDPEAEPDSEMAACARLVARRAAPDPRDLARADLWRLV